MNNKNFLARMRQWLHQKNQPTHDTQKKAVFRTTLSTVEQIEQEGKRLAQSHKLAEKFAPDILLKRLIENENILTQVFKTLAQFEKSASTTSSEWLLDNYRLIEEQIRIIKQQLTKGYVKNLPQLANGPVRGYLRIYDIALQTVAHNDGHWSAENLSRFVCAYQTVSRLTLAELWAIPTMLRLALIENLSRVGTRIVDDRTDHHLAGSWVDHMAKVAHQSDDQISTSRSILSLRRLGRTDWREFVESMSVIDQTLRKDPVGAYKDMDFTTRDRYCHVVEHLAQASQRSEEEVARTAIRLSDAAVNNTSFDDITDLNRRQHVGFYLIGAGLGELEQAVGAHYSLLEKAQRCMMRRPLSFYLGLILLITVGLTAGLLFEAYQFGTHFIWLIAFGITAALFSSQLAVALTNWLSTLIVKSHSLPKMDCSKGIPSKWRTLVVVPAMLGNSPAAVESLVRALEVRFLGNRDDALHFALLTDFNDAPQAHCDNDAALLALARRGIETLNKRYPREAGDAFFLFHRPRHWNTSEQVWMGHERKRGKLADLNALLRSNVRTQIDEPFEINSNLARTPFSLIVGRTEILANTKYVITLDSDTQLSRESAREFIGTMAHPLNQPRYDAALGRVVEGYGILQPRVADALPTPGPSRYARLCSYGSGVDPYTRTVSNVYQDLFGEGSFIGKGIYDVDMFERVLGKRFPENRILSHDLLEGCYLRSGLLTDVPLYEQPPDSYLADATRRTRWIRGDWQLLSWLLPRTPEVSGKRGKHEKSAINHLSALSRWKLFDNLRRSLVPIALLIWLGLGWTVVPASNFWLATALIVVLLPAAVATLLELLRKPVNTLVHQHLTNILHAIRGHCAQLALYFACLPHEAWYSLGAITRTTWRMAVSHRHLLEWVPSDQTGSFRNTPLAWFQMLWMGPVVAISIALWLGLNRPELLPLAAPLLVLWCASPFLLWWLSRPYSRAEAKLSVTQIRFLHTTARKTWEFFKTFVTAEDNWLPPDNYQEPPVEMLAHRTSPTNMGLTLLANLTAYDFGYITVDELLERTTNTLQTMEGLERYNGHFYNWYHTQTLKPLLPRYISSVDSGNLAGHLLTLRQGLLELIHAPLLSNRYRDGLIDTLDVLTETISESRSKRLRRFRERLRNIDFSFSHWNTVLVQLDELKAAAEKITRIKSKAHAKFLQAWSEKLALQCRALYEEWMRFEPAARTSTVSTHMTLRNIATDNFAAKRINIIETLAAQAFKLAQMEVDFLYDKVSRLMAIGYNVDEQRRDRSHYDLLSSEARLGNFVAIAQGQLPNESWFALGRLLTLNQGDLTLMSWGGSMFEYLMPLLVMPSYDETLLDHACRVAVSRQIDYGKQRGVPWGISESGLNATDAHLNYQYRIFGVPELNLRRNLPEDLVIAPYATVMALMIAPEAACANLQRLVAAGAAGQFGFYEAIDFSPSRVPRGQTNALVRSFMVHHQGMSFLALSYLLHHQPMQRRFIADPLFQATLLLLQERIPSPTAAHSTTTHLLDFITPSAQAETSIRTFDSPHTPTPEVQLLSNGYYQLMLTQAGSGYSRWKNIAITRWREDAACDHWGLFAYLRDVNTGEFWSTTYQPTVNSVDHFKAVFTEGHVEFSQCLFEIDVHTEIVVSPQDDVELRRFRIYNRAKIERTLDFTSYGEVVLAPQADDEDHPAFNNLFVETEILPLKNAILATRRVFDAQENPPWMCHLMATHSDALHAISFETDRANFIGRGQTRAAPHALKNAGPLSNTAGAVLDPIVAIRCQMTLKPGESVLLDLVTGVTETREHCLALVEKYRDEQLNNNIFGLTWTYNQERLRQLNISEINAQFYTRLAGAILYVNPALRAEPTIIAHNQRGQSGLWRYAISGDFPIVLFRIADSLQIEQVQQLIHAHTYWRQKGLVVDLVILNEAYASHQPTLQDQILRLIPPHIDVNTTDRAGGIFVKIAEQIPSEDYILLQAVARVMLSDKHDTLVEQLNYVPAEVPNTPALVITQNENPVLSQPLTNTDLLFFNGLGGFAPEGHEYIIRLGSNGSSPLRKSNTTPAPWINVLANPTFGTVISESGQAYTWIENAHEFRLTPWNNDPVQDTSGELFYLRDEETGAVWSPTALPCRGQGEYKTRHGFGYSVFEHIEDGIHSELWVYVALNASVKFSVLKVRNDSPRRRRLSATGYVEWVLGSSRTKTALSVVTETVEGGALLARNPYNTEFGERTAFFNGTFSSAHPTVRTVTGNRIEFLGRNGSYQQPAALKRSRLSGHVGAGLDPCGAIQLTFDLDEAQTHELIFTLGAGQTAQEAVALVQRFCDSVAAQEALNTVSQYWKRTLNVVQIQTPDPALNLLANGWLLYQVLACRLWGRSGYYQSGGAFGFRDQLQDVMALVHTEPQRFRAHLLLCAAHQFVEGDVQHWWHPPSGHGLRTRCSDDYLWLPLALCRYVETTGDIAVLDEMVTFLEGRPLNTNEASYYDLPTISHESASLYAHSVRAIRYGLTFGAHGLPLMGSGDWNDGMNLVGAKGQGESVWLGFFLYTVLNDFARLAQRYGDNSFAEDCCTQAGTLQKQLERNGWDGAWYRRAYFDDGTPLGSASNLECRIDSIAQSWSVLSGAAKPERAGQAMASLHQYLVQNEAALIELLTPPFDQSDPDPGYIKSYVPGIRENGGQYTHGAIWAIMAFTMLGENSLAWSLFTLINPINHGRTPDEIATYKIEPYVIAADVYSVAPHTSRGGWSWYTGSAGWMYRLITESFLGLRLQGNHLSFAPCLPADWGSFKLDYRYGKTLYQITVIRSSDINGIMLDGVTVTGEKLSLVDDQQVHKVQVGVRVC